ncbi:beta-1,4-galactosyltransferase 6-like [Patiria miniata]|uniref:Beta-1,4-galactosyltransferase n=1 Tax=Patiria miniata TaxID=46514 RepID=A0A914A1K3_PATMI|nr:beta-1,4-galactosyltransferase 6-like [Patiria miniata]
MYQIISVRMTEIHMALVACLVLGAVLQFVILPFYYFRRGVDPNWDRLEDIYITTEFSRVHFADKTIFTVPARNNNPADHAMFRQMPECPDTDIPNLNKMNFLDLDDFTMEQAESLIFGEEAMKRAKQATVLADSVVPSLIDRTDWFQTLGRRRIEAHLGKLETKIGNYTFIPGGHWKPNQCIPKWKVAVIIPFRNRSHHLPILLRYLVPMLRRQQLEFGIFTVNQENDLTFNKAMLMNIAFLESLNISQWDCFVFHDVDHVPLSDMNYYGCANMPRHFLSGDSIWNYTLMYEQLFGGVTGFLESNLRKMNGFPNVYWGWGGEDDEILMRAKKVHLNVAPRPTGGDRYMGFYKVIEHHHSSAQKIPERLDLLKNFSSRMDNDGLSNLRYPPPRLEIHPLYVNISVDIFRFDLEEK